MKLFGWKGAALPERRPALSRGWGAGWSGNWAGGGGTSGAGRAGEWPGDYEGQVRAAVLGNPVAQRAVRLVSEAAGGAAWRVEGVADAAAQARLLALVRASSGGQGLVETLCLHLLLHGNAYLQIVCDPLGAPAELYALRPDRVSVELDPRGWPVAYAYRGGSETARYPAADEGGCVAHIRAINPLDDHYGLGCVGAAAGAVAIHSAATRWNKALLDNAARPSGALVYDPGKEGGNLSASQFARLREELEAAYQGAVNAGRPILLEGGLKWQALSMSPTDMDFVALKAAAARDIALAFGVPPMLLGLPGDSTYANYREANKALWRQTILPLMTKIGDGIGQALGRWWPGVRLGVDQEQVAELSDERNALWERIGTADFLSAAEKRALLGIGPLVAAADGGAAKGEEA